MDSASIEQLVNNYKPNPVALGQLNDVTLVMTLGPSGVGKSTLMRASGIPMVVGDASRQARPDEKDGIDYNFRTLEDMKADVENGDYIQIAIGSEGDLKGTKASSFPASGPAIFAVIASAIALFRSLPFAATKTAVIVPPSFETWMTWLGQHQLAPDKLDARVNEAYQSLSFAVADPQAVFVLNDDIKAGAARLQQVAAGQTPDKNDEAKAIALALLQQLKASLG